MAAPTYRGAGGTANQFGTTSVVITAVTGNAEGDVLIIPLESTDSATAAGTPNTPGGWTKIFEQTFAAGVSGQVSTLTIFARLAPAGGSGNVTVDGVGDHCGGRMFAVTAGTHGVSNVSTDIVVGTAANHGTSTANLSIPSINVIADSLIFGIIGLSDDASDTTNASGYTNSNLASITERTDGTTTNGAGGGIAVFTATCAGTSTGATVWAHDTAVQSESLHIAISPVPPTGTGTLNSQNSTVSGSGISQSSGTGITTSQESTVSGAGTSSWIATGTLISQDSVASGSGVVEEGVVTGSGTLVSGSFTLTSTGISSSVGTGVLNSQNPTITGSGISSSIGTGILASQASHISGDGIVLIPIEGTGILVVGSSVVNGSGSIVSTGTGILIVNSATVFGTDEVIPERTTRGGAVSGIGTSTTPYYNETDNVRKLGLKDVPKRWLIEDTIKKEVDKYFSLESNYVEYLPNWWTKQEIEQKKLIIADLKQRLLNSQAIYDVYSQVVDELIQKENVFDSLAVNQTRIAQIQYLKVIDKITKKINIELDKQKLSEMIKKELDNVVQQLIDKMLDQIRQKRQKEEERVLEFLTWILS